ncbi:hypothetical protein [Fibrobacter sp.]|uniref:hypothetical protein n=1 Tax=Fibrobacter sp. TaxID=35828 RepID=UPI00388F8FFD
MPHNYFIHNNFRRFTRERHINFTLHHNLYAPAALSSNTKSKNFLKRAYNSVTKNIFICPSPKNRQKKNPDVLAAPPDFALFYEKIGARLTIFLYLGGNVKGLGIGLRGTCIAEHAHAGLDSFVVYNTIKNDLDPLKETFIKIIREGLANKSFDEGEFEAAKNAGFYKFIDFNIF